jgi:hypothetical protein
MATTPPTIQPLPEKPQAAIQVLPEKPQGAAGREFFQWLKQHSDTCHANKAVKAKQDATAAKAADPSQAAAATARPTPPAGVPVAASPGLKRAEKWQTAMQSFFDANLDKPFDWGTHDCGLFVCNHVQNLTGTDLAAEIRGKYTTATGAAKAMAKACGSASLEDFAVYLAKKFDIPELKTPLLAQRGDVVLMDATDEATGAVTPALGFVHTSGKHALFITQSGLRAFPLLESVNAKTLRRAWRIG